MPSHFNPSFRLILSILLCLSISWDTMHMMLRSGLSFLFCSELNAIGKREKEVAKGDDRRNCRDS
jgi:hypothetical protein